MTIPSAALHVETPTLADVKSSATYPPTPVTTHSQHSATSSRLDLPAPPLPEPPLPTNLLTKQEETSASDTSAQPAEGDYLSSSSPPMPREEAQSSVVDQGLHEEGQPSTGKRGNEGLTVRIDLPGMVCAPPDILPPSPPLTLADTRDEVEAGSSTLQGLAGPSTSSLSASAAPSAMREEDITNWRASMNKDKDDGEEEKQRELEENDEVGEMNGEYDPYDLGYSPETPVGPSPLHARTPTIPSGAVSPQRKDALDHPLRLNVNPPTPPLWETIGPPESMESALAAGPAGFMRVGTSGGPKPLTSRPLIPHSAYYFGPPAIDSAYGTDPVGHIGVHHPREIIRVERDYASGELTQLATTYPLELEGRITPTQFLDTINTINEHFIAAHSLRHSLVDNALAFFTLQLSRLVLHSHYEKEMEKLKSVIEDMNVKVYNPVGLNILWPRKMAFMFLEIEYY